MSRSPYKSEEKGVTVAELFDLFPDEPSAREWFERIRWYRGLTCARCGSSHVKAVKSEKPMPYRCSDCRGYFSVRTGTVMESSKISLRKWVIAIFIVTTNPEGVSSVKLHRDLSVTQKTARFMLQRLRESWEQYITQLKGGVEVSEANMRGRESGANVTMNVRADQQVRGKSEVSLKEQDTETIATKPMKSVGTGSPARILRAQGQIWLDDWHEQPKSVTRLVGLRTPYRQKLRRGIRQENSEQQRKRVELCHVEVASPTARTIT